MLRLSTPMQRFYATCCCLCVFQLSATVENLEFPFFKVGLSCCWMYATKSVWACSLTEQLKSLNFTILNPLVALSGFKFLQIRVSSANFHVIMGKVCYPLDIYVGNCYVITI